MKQPLQLFLATSFFAIFFLAASPASAQVEYMTRGQQRQEVRKSLREAQKVKSEYSESHLNMNAYNLKEGESSRKRAKKKSVRDRMEITEEGTAANPDAVVKKRKKAKKK